MSSRPLFTAFGIPVTFDPFFIFGAFLFYSWAGGGQRGMYGRGDGRVRGDPRIRSRAHGKAFGARAEITVTFLGGYASYAPSRRQTTRHRVPDQPDGAPDAAGRRRAGPLDRGQRATNATSAEELRSTYDLIRRSAGPGSSSRSSTSSRSGHSMAATSSSRCSSGSPASGRAVHSSSDRSSRP